MQWMMWLLGLGVIVVVILGVALSWQNSKRPSLGVHQGQLKPLSHKPNAVSTQADKPSQWVEPWPIKSDRDQTLAAIANAVASYGGGQLQQQADYYLYYVFVTPKMRFRDDVEFYIDAQQGLVHFRSASRVGYSDLGLNNARYQALRTLYQQQP